MKVTCPACGERQDDFGLTSFDCARCGKKLRTSRPMVVSAEETASRDSPFGWDGRMSIGIGLAIHLIGAVWLIVAIDHHDADGVWSPGVGTVVTGAVVAWVGFLLLLVGLIAYGVELIRARQGQSPA
jgi:hypothetical protein